MSLFSTIQKDMYQAMKAGDKIKAGTLRTAVAALKDRRIAKRDDLTGEEELKVIRTLAKKHRESIEMYTRGGRNDLVEREQAELSCLETYLPDQMSVEDLKELIAEVISELKASGLQDLGKVMPRIMQKGAGRVDGKQAQSLVREMLQD